MRYYSNSKEKSSFHDKYQQYYDNVNTEKGEK